MSDQESIPVIDPLRSEPSSNRELSTKALHKYIFSVITMLGVFLQLKQGPGTKSLFDTNYPTIVILIVVLIIYSGSLIGAYVLQAHLINSDLGKFISKISLFFGVLALVLELVILVPALGVAALLLWLVSFVGFVAVSSYPYVEPLFKKAVGAFEKLKDHLKNVILPAASSENRTSEFASNV